MITNKKVYKYKSTSNWQQGVAKSIYHFDWQRSELAGYDYKWVSNFSGDWSTELEEIKTSAKPKTWATRGKEYHPDHPDLKAEENDLVQADMSTDTVIFRKHFDFNGVWQTMIDALGMENTKQAFHIQYPGKC